jgi:hypothetical protein
LIHPREEQQEQNLALHLDEHRKLILYQVEI